MSQLSIASLFPFRREVVEAARVAGKDRLQVTVRPNQRYVARCSSCHSRASRLWQRESREVRDISIGCFRLVLVDG